MSSINEKLGIKPRTKKRQATHGDAIASDLRCPKCRGRHVIKCQSKHRVGQYMCGSCSEFFTPEERP